MLIRPVSEVYQPADDSHQLVNELPLGHYQDWNYDVAHEYDSNGEPVPSDGSTAVLRIHPGGMTEPVYVINPNHMANVTVTVKAGEGKLVRALASGYTEELNLKPDDQIVIRPGQAYSYLNTSQEQDLVLHDEAVPAFKPDDEVELTSSLIPFMPPPSKESSSYCIVETEHGQRTLVIPTKFFDRLGAAVASL